MNNIICIAGPTASGKTALAVELAKTFNGEVVSCDSMQIYRRMDIGTAKPTIEEMQGIPHHMIDVAEPDEDFSVSKYCEMAAPIVDDILMRGKTAIIAGGTGLYMDSLIRGNDFAPFPATGHRERLEEKLNTLGLDAMIAELFAIDPESVERAQRNPRRIIRALEVFYETGETITSHNLKTQAIPPRYDPLWLGLDFEPRQLLYDRIDLRVGIMLEMGLEKEIRDLLSSGIPATCTAMQAISPPAFPEPRAMCCGPMLPAAKSSSTWLRSWRRNYPQNTTDSRFCATACCCTFWWKSAGSRTLPARSPIPFLRKTAGSRIFCAISTVI